MEKYLNISEKIRQISESISVLKDKERELVNGYMSSRSSSLEEIRTLSQRRMDLEMERKILEDAARSSPRYIGRAEGIPRRW